MDLKQLDQLIKLCRKRGVTSVKIGDVELHLNQDQPQPRRQVSAKAKADQAYSPVSDMIESEQELSEEELLFYSVTDSSPTPQQ